MPEIMRAVAYARFSSDMQRDESIDAQVRAIGDYAEKNGYVLLSSYIDKAFSGTNDKRPEFQRMIADAQKNKFDAIIVHKYDRFARNRFDSATYKHLFKKNNVRLISVMENFDDSPESIILESVIEGYNEYYSRNLAREVEKGKRENAINGRHVGGKPPLGYDVDRSTMKLIINDVEAEAIRMIFKMYLLECGYSEIIDYLNSNGFRTKRGNLFGKNSLFEILRNEKYCGMYTYNKSVSKNIDGKFNRHKSKDEKDIIRIDGGLPAIVSKEDFAAAQVKMKKRKNTTAKFTAKQDYLLSGKIVCGICGSSYIGNSRKPRPDHPLYVSYKCSKKNGALKCKNPEIRRDTLEELVLEKLSSCIFDESILPRLSKAYKEYVLKMDSNLTNRIKGIKDKLIEIDRGIQNIIKVILETGSSALNVKLKELEKEKGVLAYTLSDLETKLLDEQLDEKKIKLAFRKAKKMLKDGSLENKRIIVQKYVNKIVMFHDRIEIIFNLTSKFTISEVLGKE